MDKVEIKSFIDQTIDDFQTIDRLLGHDRPKETVVIMGQVLDRIRAFKFNGLFQETFWDKDFSKEVKMGDWGQKVKEMAARQKAGLDIDPDLQGYERFVQLVRDWAYDNIYHLRQAIKSPMQSRIEFFLIFISAGAIGLCLAAFVYMKIVPLYARLTDNSNTLFFDTKDVVSGQKWMQDVTGNHPQGWPSENQLVVKSSTGPVWVNKGFIIPGQGKYRITIFHSSNNNNIQATVRLSCMGLFERPLNTVSAEYTFGKDVYTCEFPAGRNSVRITGTGDDAHSYLGLNSVSLKLLK